jgi:hypothetical protein
MTYKYRGSKVSYLHNNQQTGSIPSKLHRIPSDITVHMYCTYLDKLNLAFTEMWTWRREKGG